MRHTKELEDMERLLKPCPFCGSRARAFRCVELLKRAKSKVRGPYYFVGCTDPDCILYSDGRIVRLMFRSTEAALMLRRWNRRRENDG